jgi:putative PIN family toxin of toxin-antitoxin system
MAIVALIDTNVWVSALINPHGFPAKARDAWLAGRYKIVVSKPMLEELEDVLHRPRIQQRFGVTEAQAEELLLLITEKATPVEISGELHLCRDDRDDMLLETAIVGGATHIVSRDEDITRDLELQEQLEKRRIKAVTVSRFLAEVGK